MRRRLIRAICGRLGHRPPQLVAGTYDGRYVAAEICPRCKFIFRSEVGPRRERRRAWRERMAAR